jgi:hypothetical protein
MFVQSNLFNDTVYKIVGVFISNVKRWKQSGSKQRERGREGEREQLINGVRDRALEGFGNGVGSKWSLGKRTPEYFI